MARLTEGAPGRACRGRRASLWWCQRRARGQRHAKSRPPSGGRDMGSTVTVEPSKRPVGWRAMADPIPIIGGTGALGYGLAIRWARAGQAVVIGSRKPERAEEAAGRVGAAVPEA